MHEEHLILKILSLGKVKQLMKKTHFIRLVFLVQRSTFTKFYTFQKIFSEN